MKNEKGKKKKKQQQQQQQKRNNNNNNKNRMKEICSRTDFGNGLEKY